MSQLVQSNITLAETWDIYKDQQPVSFRTAKLDGCLWNLYIGPLLGSLPLAEIKGLVLLKFRKELEKKLSPQTVKHCLSQIRRIIRKAIQWELYSGLVPVFNMPRFDNRRMRFLTPFEAQNLLEALKYRSELWHDISLFALNTGLRSAEIFNLQPHSINLSEKRLYILDSKNSSSRAVPLNNTALGVVQKYYSKHPAFVFTNYEGEQLRYVSKSFSRTVEELGLNSGVKDRRQRIVFHSLRHTFASWLVQAGQALPVVGDLLGHKSIDMTKRYAHLAPEQGITAVLILDKVCRFEKS